ncbi:MAG: hypothetical protein U0325_01795 [Polyangiales bacterium]
MNPPIPRWIRALLLADRAVHSTVRLAALLRTELLLAGADARTRDAVNALVFSAEDTYAPGGPAFDRGLFAWERDALAHPAFPRAGRVLLGGAGGGRERVALTAAGYTVDAFEPAEALHAALTSHAAGGLALQGSYADLVRAATAADGPLAALRGQDYDGVVFGWASFTHLTTDGEADAALRAVRALAPRATVLVSYLGPDDDGRANGRVEALRPRVRATLARLAGRAEPVAGEGFAPGAGFYRRFAPTEFEALARGAGYDVAMHAAEPYPHALLRPRDA